jgi:hypothetical protein
LKPVAKTEQFHELTPVELCSGHDVRSDELEEVSDDDAVVLEFNGRVFNRLLRWEVQKILDEGA